MVSLSSLLSQWMSDVSFNGFSIRILFDHLDIPFSPPSFFFYPKALLDPDPFPNPTLLKLPAVIGLRPDSVPLRSSTFFLDVIPGFEFSTKLVVQRRKAPLKAFPHTTVLAFFNRRRSWAHPEFCTLTPLFFLRTSWARFFPPGARLSFFLALSFSSGFSRKL